jgi:anti-sigma factor RsiW
MFLSIQKHCSDERLLAYADGELPGRTADKTARHLAVCWQCRARLDEMENQAYAVARALSDDSLLHPLHMAETKERLIAAQREYERRLASEISVRLRVSAGLCWAAAPCACMGLLAVVQDEFSSRQDAAAHE